MRAFAFRTHSGIPVSHRVAHKMGAGSSRGSVATRASSVPEGLSDGCKGAPVPEGVKLPIVCGEEVMAPKKHGTTDAPVQQNLRWGCEWKTADKICSFNRHYAEFAGYWATTNFLQEVDRDGETTYYDSVTGKPLFIAPRGRSMEAFLKESKAHGWPSFRDEEVVWENVRCLVNGEAVSTAGTHLGHNLPDKSGNRYCINLVSVAGRPA